MVKAVNDSLHQVGNSIVTWIDAQVLKGPDRVHIHWNLGIAICLTAVLQES